jgi:hypothetical protein
MPESLGDGLEVNTAFQHQGGSFIAPSRSSLLFAEGQEYHSVDIPSPPDRGERSPMISYSVSRHAIQNRLQC